MIELSVGLIPSFNKIEMLPNLIGYCKRVRAVVSKRGVDDGNQKVGALSSPPKRANINYTKKK